MTPVTFRSEGATLHGSVYHPSSLHDNTPAVLLIHGWQSSQKSETPYAAMLAEAGYIAMTFDMRGHGASEGVQEQMTREDFLTDAQYAYDYVKHLQGVDPDRISVIGSSLGGYLAACLSAHRRVHSMVLRVPANYPDDGFDTQTLTEYTKSPTRISWRTNKLEYHATHSLRAVHEFTGRLMIVESELDMLVPRETIENYLNAAHKYVLTHTIMKGAEHSISRDPSRVAEYTQLLRTWFA